ncbi:alpha-L-fucosidase [uncultured Draconibacterium sp.]|uniref:alpha-L-fucosidase n=1 Tax=uncultured Draconibacterium sp. TaxID=1573823 RepID=UPI003260DD1B
MERKFIILSIFLFCVSIISQGQIEEHYSADWESLSKHNQAPEWFADAKLGIYFHWGIYSVPAYNGAWYPFDMYRDGTKVKEYHTKTYGDPSEFSYHDFVPQFTAEHFDAADWAQLFKDAGAKFAGPCAQHHDGFALWDSRVNPWNAADRGPKQDITGKLEKAVKRQGMKFITTFHHARNLQRHKGDSTKWDTYTSHYAYHPNYATSSTNPDTAKLYGNIPEAEFHQYWFDQLKEVIDQYSPDIIWFDSWLKLIPEEYRQAFAAYYLNEAKKKKQEVVIAYKQKDMPASVGVLDIEQGGKKDLSESVWLTDITLSTKTWCYTKDQQYKSAAMVVRNMIDVWSKNGVVLLNVSPMANGIINQQQRVILREIGGWMNKYQEAIYETRAFDVYGFGTAKTKDGHFGGQTATTQYTAADGRFLKSKDEKTLYLFMLGKPTVGNVIELSQLAPHTFYPEKGIKRISVMGTDIEVPWKFGKRHIQITVPDAALDEIATVFKIELN